MSEPTQPDPQGDRPGQTGSAPVIPECIALILHAVRILINYGRNLDATFAERLAHTEYPTLAAGFGTYDTKRILAHIERGVLRALMLKKYLLALAAKGRDIEPKPWAPAADQDEIEALNLKVQSQAQVEVQRMRVLPTPRRRPQLDPDDPLKFYIQTAKEIEAQVRRRSIGRTIAEICMDLGITYHCCDSRFWDLIYYLLRNYDESRAYELMHEVDKNREASFQKERDRDMSIANRNWHWRDRRRETFREIFGRWIGEPPLPEEPGSEQTTAPP